jgi:DNA-binding transcriptional LysR family regulator
LNRGNEHWEGIPPGRATANSPELLMQMALAGAGITVITDHFALPHLRRGELVQVVPDWRLPPVSAWAVFPGRRLMPARTRVFVDALAAKFIGPQCQQIEAEVVRTKARLRGAPPRASSPRTTTAQTDEA